MPNLSGGLGNLAARAAANRRLAGSGGMLGGLGRAAGSYARQLRGWFTTPQREALGGVRQIARGLQRGLPPIPGTPPPVVPGLAAGSGAAAASHVDWNCPAFKAIGVDGQEHHGCVSAASPYSTRAGRDLVDHMYYGMTEASC